MTVEQIAAIVGIVLSLGFTLIPGLNAKFAGLAGDVKMSVMGILDILVGVAVFGLACAPGFTFLGLTVTCDAQGLAGLVNVIIAAIIANQGVNLVIPKPQAVKAAKAARMSK